MWVVVVLIVVAIVVCGLWFVFVLWLWLLLLLWLCVCHLCACGMAQTFPGSESGAPPCERFMCVRRLACDGINPSVGRLIFLSPPS